MGYYKTKNLGRDDMVRCRYMEQEENQVSPTVQPGVASPENQPPSADDTSRQRYTMTVEDVAAELHLHGLDRDARTIQRWCKSGKVEAFLDVSNGERWLIEPGSLRRLIEKIVADMSRRPQAFTPTQAATSEPVATSQPTQADAPETTNVSQSDGDDGSAATSESSRDDDAAQSRRVAALETEVAMLRADVKVREQMVEYLKTQFEEMMNTALEKTERTGKLVAENEYLRNLLPPREQGSFAPRGLQDIDVQETDSTDRPEGV